MRTMTLLAPLMAGALLAGCSDERPRQAQTPQSVDFETTPCFGSCPVFKVRLFSDGKGEYEGGRFVAQKGKHEFTATPEQVEAFFARVAKFRPKGEATYDMGHCAVPAHTDASSINVTWRGPAGEDALHWNLGCRDPKLSAIQPDLREAWKELPLDDLVGTAENRFQYDQRGG